jgi:hypothetical protein
MLQRTLPTGFIAPCLPTKAHTLPSGGLWLHEIKHDGFPQGIQPTAPAARPIGSMKNSDAPAVKREAEKDWAR